MAAKVMNQTRCVIIAGAPEADAAFIQSVVRADDYIVCADRGAAAALAAGLKPDLIVGDFDSFAGSLPDNCEIIRLCPEKDDTDTQHAIDTALSRGFRDFVLLAATGGRLDHTYANLCMLAYLARRGAEGVILAKNKEVRLLTDGTYDYSGRCGQTFSVFPFGCPDAVLSYTGAKYPLNRGKLIHSGAMGVSNIFVGDTAAITVHSGEALVFCYAQIEG